MARAALLLTLSILLLLPNQASARDMEARYREAAQAFHNLRVRRDATAADWNGVASEFYSLYQAEPLHKRGADALFSAALSLRRAHRAGGEPDDLKRAVAWFEKFAHIYPSHSMADDSLMHVGEIQAGNLGDGATARKTYLRVAAAYPNGDQAALARKRTAIAKAKGPGMADGGPQAVTKPGVTNTAYAEPGIGKRLTPGNRATIKRLDYWSLKNRTRVILTTDKPVPYKVQELQPRQGRPHRVYIDLKPAMSAGDLAAEY
ncbi:MAG: hypothetical protein V3S64_00440, partial [bacterium]